MKKNFWLLTGAFFLISFFLLSRTKKGLQVSENVKEKLLAITRSWWPKEKDDLFVKAGNKHGIDPRWLKAIAINESQLGKFRQLEPIGKTTGLMHVKESTAKDYDKSITVKDLEKDDIAVDIAARHLKALLNFFKDEKLESERLRKAIISYNQGQGNTKKGKLFPIAKKYWDDFQKNMEKMA